MSDNPFKKGAEKAAEEADKITAEEESKLKAPTWEEVKNMLPEPQDQEELARLIKIVNQDTTHNEKVASLIKNISSVASVVVKTLQTLK